MPGIPFLSLACRLRNYGVVPGTDVKLNRQTLVESLRPTAVIRHAPRCNSMLRMTRWSCLCRLMMVCGSSVG